MKAWAHQLLEVAAVLAAAAFLLDWTLSTLSPWLPLFAFAVLVAAFLRRQQR